MHIHTHIHNDNGWSPRKKCFGKLTLKSWIDVITNSTRSHQCIVVIHLSVASLERCNLATVFSGRAKWQPAVCLLLLLCWLNF